MKKKERTVLQLFDYLPDKDGKKRLMPKMKMKIKKFGRMNLIFGVSKSKLVYMTIFMKLRKKLDHFLRHF